MNWLRKKFSSKPISVEDPVAEANRLEIEDKFLREVQYNDIDFFHLKGYNCRAKVVKVYDGDTITVVFFLNGKPFKWRIRLAGIDTAEKRSTDKMETIWALRGVNRMNDLLGVGMMCYLNCYKWDKYGRLLADVMLHPNDKETLNQIMLREQFAYKYDGGKRRDFRDWAPWDTWLDDPWFKKAEDAKTVDNIGDPEVIIEKVERSEKDFSVKSNAVNMTSPV